MKNVLRIGAIALGMLAVATTSWAALATVGPGGIQGDNEPFAGDPFNNTDWMFVAELTDDFQFIGDPGGSQPQGRVASVVLASTETGAFGEGYWVYMYQIQLDPPANEIIRALTAPFNFNSVAVNEINVDGGADVDTTFYINLGGGAFDTLLAGTDFLAGSVPPSGTGVSDLTETFLAGFGSIVVPTLISPNDSFVFGVVSTLPPRTGIANLVDSGIEISPEVLVPVPEPSVVLLMGLGLSTLAAWRRRR